MNEYNTILVSMCTALIIGSYLWVWYESSLTVTDAEKMIVDRHCRNYLESFESGVHVTDSYSIRKLSGNRFQVKYIVFSGLGTQTLRATLLVKMDGSRVEEINSEIEGTI